MAFRPTGYQKAFLEVSSALQQNQEAFKTLHTVYKLPNSYASLPASATVQAMEALGVFSENDPVGIIDLPLVVGMKSTHKKVKKQMRTRVKYQGFKGITYGKVKPQLEKIVATIHETFQLLISQIELLDMVVANQENGTSNQLDSVILAVKNSKDMMDKSVEVVHKHDGKKHAIQVSQRNTPLRFVPKRVQYNDSPIADTQDRKHFDPIPIPNESETQPILSTPPRVDDLSPSRNKEFFSTRQQETSLSQPHQNTFTDDYDDDYLTASAHQPMNKVTTGLLSIQKQQLRKASPGPATKPKPQRQTKVHNPHGKLPIMPPNSVTETSSKTDSVCSNFTDPGYVRMNPVESHDQRNLEGGINDPHGYVNVGGTKAGRAPPIIPQFQKLKMEENEVLTDSESEMAFEEYETF